MLDADTPLNREIKALMGTITTAGIAGRRPPRRLLPSLWLLLLLGTLPTGLHAAERVALVIGNGAYQHGNPLKNPTADARDVAASLKQCGFELVGGAARTDLSHEDMSGALTAFRKASANAKVTLFFFAGHGLELGGENYLVPVDAEIEAEHLVKHRTVSLDEVMGTMAEKDRLKIVILDCCRDNPLGRGWGRNLTAGLSAPRSTPRGTILLFSAAPGQVAKDGKGHNSPFSGVLKTELLKPGLEIEKVFKNVGTEVWQSTGSQEPWMNSSFYGNFAFLPGTNTNTNLSDGESAMVPTLSPAPAPAASASKTDTPRQATSDKPFENGLGMKFVPVLDYTDGSRVLFSIWETRLKDYAAYAAKNPGIDMKWNDQAQKCPGPDHPVIYVNWDDAKAFSAWLTKTERAAGQIGPEDEYRLPTDLEWSYAVGIGEREMADASPERKDGRIGGVYPWGTAWPPTEGAGNFSGQESSNSYKIAGYRDLYPYTAPVGSYEPNERGIFDLGGNVYEWCEDWYESVEKKRRVLRGGSWGNSSEEGLRSSFRNRYAPDFRYDTYGFRVALVIKSGN